MPIDQPIPGQRWVSDSEPELGLGIILKAEYGQVEIYFPAAKEHRRYAMKSAPLRRVRFKEGDRIKLHNGVELAVESVEETKGIVTYKGGGKEASEAELSDKISFSSPEERLLAGQVDDHEAFALRAEVLERRTAVQQSPVRGYVGGRVDLIPHQMSIAGEVAGRLVPRVLLADEVGELLRAQGSFRDVLIAAFRCHDARCRTHRASSLRPSRIRTFASAPSPASRAAAAIAAAACG